MHKITHNTDKFSVTEYGDGSVIIFKNKQTLEEILFKDGMSRAFIQDIENGEFMGLSYNVIFNNIWNVYEDEA